MKAFNGEAKSVAQVRRLQRHALRLGLEIAVPVGHDDADDELHRQPGLRGGVSSWAAGWPSATPSPSATSRRSSSTCARSPSRSPSSPRSPTSCSRPRRRPSGSSSSWTKPRKCPRPASPVRLETVGGAVEFQHVHFGYSPDKIIINDFSRRVEPGQKIAIVGPTGAGKTTMVKLLMRFYDVNSGAILVDGHDIREFTRARPAQACSAWCCRTPGCTTARSWRTSATAAWTPPTRK